MKHCKPCITVSANEIAIKKGVATITVADNALQPIIGTCRADVRICVNTSIDTTSECNQIEITDGTSTLEFWKCNQYWRPTRIICNSIICTEYKNDPELLVFKGGAVRG